MSYGYSYESRFVALIEDDGLTHYLTWTGEEWRITCRPDDHPCFGCVTYLPTLPLCGVCLTASSMEVSA